MSGHIKLTIILRTLILLLLYFGVLPFLCFAEQQVELQNGWQYHWGDGNWQPIEDVTKIPNPDHRTDLWVKITLTDTKIEDAHLFLFGVYGGFAVYLDETKIYDYASDKIDSVVLSYPNYYHLILLPQKYSGKVLSITIHSDYFQAGINTTVYILSATNIKKGFFLKDIDYLFVAIFFLVTGISSMFLYWTNKDMMFVDIAIFQFCGSVLTIGFTYTKQILIESPIFLGYAMHISAFVAGVTFFIFVANIVENVTIKKVWQLILIFGICSIFAIRFVSISLLSIGLMILIASGMIILIAISINQIRYGSKEVKTLVFGLIIFGGFTIIDILLQLGILPWQRSIGHWGHLFLSLVFIKILLQRQKKAKTNIDCHKFNYI